MEPMGESVVAELGQLQACRSGMGRTFVEDFHRLSKEISVCVLKVRHHDRVMRLWTKTVVPVLAALAAVLLAAAGASGVDQMANTKVTNVASVTIPAVGADSQPPLQEMTRRAGT
jgi:hypothetical protein